MARGHSGGPSADRPADGGERDHRTPLDVPQWALDADLSLLTGREREVLVALGHCLPNAAIAAACHITERTVKKHVAGIFLKLGITSRAEAAVIATWRMRELRESQGCRRKGVLASTSYARQGDDTV
jgi:DNA-binding NarL/FixJ family response regulator